MKGRSAASYVTEGRVRVHPQQVSIVSPFFLCDGFSATSSRLPVISSWISSLLYLGEIFPFLPLLGSPCSCPHIKERQNRWTRKILRRELGQAKGRGQGQLTCTGWGPWAAVRQRAGWSASLFLSSGTAPCWVLFLQRRLRLVPCPKELTEMVEKGR